MSMSLYHIDQELENLIDHETGEVLDFDAFEALQMARDAKIEGVLCWTKNLAAEAKAIREEEKELAERRKAMERKREKLLAYAERALGGAAFQTARCAVTYRKSTAVEITDMDAVVQLEESCIFQRMFIHLFTIPVYIKGFVHRIRRKIAPRNDYG